MSDRDDDQAWAELGAEQEYERIAALDRCVQAGADPEAIRVLAEAAGISYRDADRLTREMFDDRD